MSRLGAVIPTRNSETYLSRHLDGLETWLDLADEIVVVDSDSTDRTQEILRSRLKGPRVRFLSHPPGLYESWNFGLAHLGSEWAYISTIGDTIDRAGMEHLLQSAEQLDCDVLCSPPAPIHPDGRFASSDSPPLTRMLDELGVNGAALLTPTIVVTYAAVFAIAHGLNTPMGSSASNLYRRATLCARPFTVAYGSAGDAFWLLESATGIRYAATTRHCAGYLLHPSQHGDVSLAGRTSQSTAAARLSFTNLQWLSESGALWEAERDELAALLSRLDQLRAAETALEEIRHGMPGRFWSVRPVAWEARHARNRLREECEAMRLDFVAGLRASGRAITKIV